MSPNKAWSLSYTRSMILFLFCLMVILVMSLLMISSGLRCVDRDGCIREHCAGPKVRDHFYPEYIDILRNSIQGNLKCRIDIFGKPLN